MSTNKTVNKRFKTFDARKHVNKTDDSNGDEVLAPTNVRSHADQIDHYSGRWREMDTLMDDEETLSSFRGLPLNVDPDASHS